MHISSCHRGFSPAQTLLTSTTGTISFYSEAPLEKIEARNRKFVVKYDPSSGKIEATVLMKGFEFKKALMQEHFNENYVESDKYPKSFFTGSVNTQEISLLKNNVYNVLASGTLTLHGVSQKVSVPGSITIKDGSLSLKAVFDIQLADYKIKIPTVVRNNIGKTVTITIVADHFK
ncbi:MAG: YceI family protein [Chitinophagaceae bacterium]|nr:MAG: YceI family protein [Chitinophagaceae bacterium]